MEFITAKDATEKGDDCPKGDSYEIRLYDTPLLTFALIDGGLGYDVNVQNISENKDLLPLDLELTGEGLLKWLQRRVIPKNRTFVEEILRALGLSIGNTKGIIDVCKGLSLNDSYWIVPVGFEGKFADFNLYENRFSEILSLVAYTGVTQSDAAFSTSPELTTDGMLPKAWRFIESDSIYLYKGSTSGFANTGKEPYCEYYASQVAAAMNLDAVHYDLENWKAILASKCKLFTDIGTAFIPIGRIVKSGGISAVVKHYDRLGEEFTSAVRDMLVFDALIYNEDRHFGNFGLLRNNKTGEIIAPAPIFDNGISLFNYAMKDDYANLDAYAKTRSTVYAGTTFEGICQEVMTARQVEKLRKMLNFTFMRHPKLNLPEEHLAAIEKHLRKRAAYLIGLSRVTKQHLT
ncbi:MAG: XRE family transcriptional regulator [Oscillospiraceae bacterium]|nr:XRE family transcriptional regulator [Oscillospiraceae bacterium]